jgi:hypothetical protein
MIWPVLKAFGIAALLGFLRSSSLLGALWSSTARAVKSPSGSFGHGPSTGHL